MSAITGQRGHTTAQERASSPVDPRVARTRAAAVEAARSLFLEKGYAGTTMDEIAAAAGLARRTLYNNYTDKSALFTEIVAEVVDYAESFARDLPQAFDAQVRRADLPDTLHALGRRLALGILRPEVIALRRLLIGEARTFPDLARDYFDRAPGRVVTALAFGFEDLADLGLLDLVDPRRAAEQFAYLVVGASLDRAVVVGTIPPREQLLSSARDGVETFLARYARAPRAPGASAGPTVTPSPG